MSDSPTHVLSTSVTVPGAVLQSIETALAEIRDRLNGSTPALSVSLDQLPEDAREAAKALEAAKARGHFTVREYAAVIGRRPHYVSNHCAAKVIKTFGNGKTPYRIPLDEYEEWKTGVSGVFRGTKPIKRFY